MKKIKTFKVFNGDWTCNDYQFKVGKEYHIDGVISICNRGFHSCKKLIDCFNYYPLVQWCKFAECEAFGKIQAHSSDSKICSSDIKIVKELSFEDVLKILRSDRSNGSNGINRSNGINWSYGINWSNGINESYGINRSNGITESNGINWSNGINESNGINRSDGINRSYGINWSYGINRSNGISGSKFLNDCKGLSDSIFCNGLKNQYYIFNKKVSKKRYETILSRLNELLNGWSPQFHNAKELYLKSGSERKKTPINLIKENENPYADMPKEAIKYIKSLKEFNKTIFKQICKL